MFKIIAMLATNGFEESELKSPKEHLEKQGWEVQIISIQDGTIKSWAEKDWGDKYTVDKMVNEVSAKDYDALVIPGGVLSPDKLRTNLDVLRFVKDFFEQQKIVAAICHGPQVLIDAEVVRDRKMTSVNNIAKDLINAGAIWSDSPVIVDAGLITSRTPEDLPVFNEKIVEAITEVSEVK